MRTFLDRVLTIHDKRVVPANSTTDLSSTACQDLLPLPLQQLGTGIRHGLKRFLDRHATFSATFVRFGSSNHGRTALLRDIRDERGKIVADHVWLTYTEKLSRLALQAGDTLHFKAIVKRYSKAAGAFDYGLFYPSNLRVERASTLKQAA